MHLHDESREVWGLYIRRSSSFATIQNSSHWADDYKILSFVSLMSQKRLVTKSHKNNRNLFLWYANTIYITSNWSILAVWFVLSYDQLEDRWIDDVINICFCSFIIKQLDSMLPCACSVKDHSWNVSKLIRKSVTHSAIISCAFFTVILTSSMINWLLYTLGNMESSYGENCDEQRRNINMKLMLLVPGFVTISNFFTMFSMVNIRWHMPSTISNDKNNS